jgi:hypothetical protein
MIVSEYVAPNQNIFYIGAKLIELISKQKSSPIDTMKLYNEYIKHYNEISFEYYMISLTWLYILNLIDNSDINGDIKKCF